MMSRGESSTSTSSASASSVASPAPSRGSSSASGSYRSPATAEGPNIEDVRTKVCCVVMRRSNPAKWSAHGVPQLFQHFGRLYDILLSPNMTSDAEQSQEVYSLLKKPASADQDPLQVALSISRDIKPKRAVFVDVVYEPEKDCHLLVYALPVDHIEESGDGSGVAPNVETTCEWVRLHNLLLDARGLRQHGPDRILTPSAKRTLAALDAWLASIHTDAKQVLKLWTAHADKRVRTAIRNPAYTGETPAQSVFRQAPRAAINPLFQSTIVLPTADKRSRVKLNTQLQSEALDERLAMYDPEIPPNWVHWAARFPVHEAAMLGQTGSLHFLLQGEHSAKAKDSEGWTPLHYASWYGQEDIVRILMEDWRGAPAELNQSHATALHLAARNGYAEIVRLLVACPIVEINHRDANGDTPLSLCQQAQLNDWQDVAAILTNPEKYMHAVNRFGKVQMSSSALHDFRIHFLDGTVKVIRLPSVEVSALDVRDATAAMLQLPEDLYDIFGVWVVAEAFQVELERNTNPVKQAERLWAQMSSEEDGPRLYFKRSALVPLHEERRVLSQVALKLLFDEALHNVLQSKWPTSLDDAAHLGGLLMQIRFGDYNPETHVPGFLRGGLETFVPQHLLHNQLRTVEWERRIFAEHQKHKGVTEILPLHRLYLQYCRQWPYYGATLFDGVLLKSSRRKKADDVTVGVNSDFVSIITKNPMALKAHLSWDEFKFELDDASCEISFLLKTSSTAKLEELQAYVSGATEDQRIVFVVHQAQGMAKLMNKLLDLSQRADEALEMKRMAQGGPRVHKLVSNQPAPLEPLSRVERLEIEHRQNKEMKARYKVVHSFGTAYPRRGDSNKSAAEAVFDKFCGDDGLASVNDLKVICYELGYWLGPELEGAGLILDSGGTNLFSFRDLISWWCQSSRSWLYLLDDAAFKKRHEAVHIFLRNDPNRTGKVSDEKLSGLINGLRSSGLTRKTEEAIRKGLDPGNTGFLAFNTYVDWLTNLHIIHDRKLS